MRPKIIEKHTYRERATKKKILENDLSSKFGVKIESVN